jgi:hypothetical protein
MHDPDKIGWGPAINGSATGTVATVRPYRFFYMYILKKGFSLDF